MVTLIGDVVGSRRYADRYEVQRTLMRALKDVGTSVESLQRLEPTVGDEFQGGYATLAAATRAALEVQLLLAGAEDPLDVRVGIGWGDVTVFDDRGTPLLQDGPGWWAARSAIERAHSMADESRTAAVRSCFAAAEGFDGCESAVDAYLWMRDAIVSRMNPRHCLMLLGRLRGRTLQAIAADLGVTHGAVIQALQKNGGYMVEAAVRRFEGDG